MKAPIKIGIVQKMRALKINSANICLDLPYQRLFFNNSKGEVPRRSELDTGHRHNRHHPRFSSFAFLKVQQSFFS